MLFADACLFISSNNENSFLFIYLFVSFLLFLIISID